jgi:hypothetical protein
MGEFDQGEIEAFGIGYWGFERKCIPDNESNRECVLVSCLSQEAKNAGVS